jgi:molybdenum cofactor synthesis domain-containing protein
VSSIILTVGNEILTGHILDTNSHWLAERLFLLGEEVKNIIVVGDDEDEIVKRIQESIGTVEYLFVCGGLGSTPDDVTMAAVARATKRDLTVSEKALQHMETLSDFLLEKGFIKTKMEINDAVLKMASVVTGSTVLENKAGFCPGATFRHEKSRIFILPGVPQELKTIFTAHIERVYIEPKHKRFIEEIVLSQVEARIAHLLSKINERFPGVSVGSYPTYGALRLVIRAMGEDKDVVQTVLREIKEYSDSLPEI